MMWLQIGDDRVSQIPPDGITAVDVYVDFSFSGMSLPEGVVVKFLAGKGDLNFGGNEETVKQWTESEVVSSIVPVDGVILVATTSKTTKTLIRNSFGKLESRIVAKATLKPVANILKDELAIVGYTSYDKTGIITNRLQPDIVKAQVASRGGVFLSATERYNPAANSWETVAPMPTGRSGLFVEEVGGKIYAIGGFAGTFLANNEEYDPAIDSWAIKAPIPEARAFGMSVVYGGEIYVIGGTNFSPGACSKSVSKYNPVANSWTELADMPLPVGFGIAKAIGGAIYIMFGASQIDGTGKGESETIKRFNLAIFKYDIALDAWSVDDVQLTSPIATSLSASAIAGDEFLSIPISVSLPPYGVVIINNGGASEETHTYSSYDSKSGTIRLDKPLSNVHFLGESVRMASIPEIRIAPSAATTGASIDVFDGQQFFAYAGNSDGILRGTLCSYDTGTRTFACGLATPLLPRSKAATALVGSTTYIIGGSSGKSQWANELEILSAGIFSGPSGLAQMLFPRHSLGATVVAGLLYAIGGAGDGHEPGWLRITVTTTPESVRADGRETSSVRIDAVDASGDPPPDGTKFSIRGLIYVTTTQQQQEEFKNSLTDAQTAVVQTSTGGTGAKPPPQRISILPVLFAAKTVEMSNGVASTIAMPRSEDPIREVSNLASFVKLGEAIIDETKLREQLGLPENDADKIQIAGEKRELYGAAIEVSVNDSFFFGATNSDALIASKSQEGDPTQNPIDFSPKSLANSTSFSFNPAPAEQGLSANIKFYSDIASIPDVQLLTSDAVPASEAKSLLDKMGQETPFGASPLFDAISRATEPRVDDPVTYPVDTPTSIFLSVSDNEESDSARTAQDVADDANGIAGDLKSPVFLTSFVTTDPVSLAARRARTDVADLERIASETGGNSFTVVDSSYVDFVIERIKTSAPSSIGSGTVVSSHEINGYLSSVSFVVSNLVAGNSALMSIFVSNDGYNFSELASGISPNVLRTFPEPVKTANVRYEILLRSKTFDSPKLESVSLYYVSPNVQYLFTFPQELSGQVSELGAVANHRLPGGGFVEMGFFHGESFMFDRDYGSITQPTIKERGVTMAINRSFDTLVGKKSTSDALVSDDFLIYKSISGPWSQESTTRVYVNNILAPLDAYALAPEDGVVAFRKKLGPSDTVIIEVDQPNAFRFGMKIVNPSSSSIGHLDSFAYAWGTTDDSPGYRLNRAPRAVNLFVTPSPVLPGGPMKANYTFVDPDGDSEDKTQTVITWFRNGMPIPELSGKRSVTNADLIAQRATSDGIAKGQEWFFTVRPSDGSAFGPVSTSSKVIVTNVPPSINKVSLQSSGDDPSKLTSQDSAKAIFDFADSDNDKSSGSIFTWFVNGVEAQSGTSDSLAPTGDGGKTFRAGDSIRCEVIPSDGQDFGTPVSSDTVTVLGSAPAVEDFVIVPKTPSSLSNLRLTYKFIDLDERTDSSAIRWFRNNQRVSELDNTKQVSSVLTSPGQEWHAEITPNNGLVDGDVVKSNVVTIDF